MTDQPAPTAACDVCAEPINEDRQVVQRTVTPSGKVTGIRHWRCVTTPAAARADWLEGYEFALRNLNDEAVQADLRDVEAVRTAAPGVPPSADAELAGGGLSSRFAPRRSTGSGAHDERARWAQVVEDAGMGTASIVSLMRAAKARNFSLREVNDA